LGRPPGWRQGACPSAAAGKSMSMSRTDFRNPDGAFMSSATAGYLGAQRGGALKYVPGFAFILALFVAGKFIFPDQRATLVEWGQYHLSWVEILMVGAAVMALFEQLRVSHPGVDNTIDAMLMGAVAGIQVLGFALGAAGVKPLAIFNNTEFLMLTLISMCEAAVAVLINARTLRRTIGVGGSV
jgi:hypothetical protein